MVELGSSTTLLEDTTKMDISGIGACPMAHGTEWMHSLGRAKQTSLTKDTMAKRCLGYNSQNPSSYVPLGREG